MFYIYIKDEKIFGKGQCKCTGDDISNLATSEEIYNNIEKYIYRYEELVLNPNYEEEQKQKEKERLAMLSLTRGDVFRGLLQAKQVTRAQIRAMIENNNSLGALEKEMALIDFDEALNFYRGNSLINILGMQLGIKEEQLNEFFETGDYTALLSTEEEKVDEE